MIKWMWTKLSHLFTKWEQKLFFFENKTKANRAHNQLNFKAMSKIPEAKDIADPVVFPSPEGADITTKEGMPS